MIHQFERTRNVWKHSLFLAAGLFLGTGMNNAVGAAEDTTETYTWHAELVSFDESARTVTVKARVVDRAGIEGLSDLAEGDRVMLTWSGISWAAGIRSITPGTDTEFDRMTLPVEFVASVMDDQYVEFRLPVPEEYVTRIASLTPGQWVTATSPHLPADWDGAITSIRAYTDVDVS